MVILCAAYMSSPCHIELILSEKEEPVKKEVIWLNESVLKILQYEGIYIYMFVISYFLTLILQPETQLATSKSKKSQALWSGASS